MIEVQTPVAPERVTPIKPSEALRLGRLSYPVRLTGETFGADWMKFGSHDPRGACAVGAILAGFGANPGDWRESDANLPTDDAPDCPHGCAKDDWDFCFLGNSTYVLVMHLNDHHHATDDEIVAYLEGRGL